MRILALLAGGYLVIVGFMYLGQEQMLYLPGVPGRDLVSTPEDIGLEYDSVEIMTEDGVRLHGWHVHADDPRATVLFFHGNAGNISHRLDSLRIFHELDMDVLIIDYRGYGQSEGSPSEEGLYRDAEAAWRYLTRERGVEPERIIAFGRSLGGAVAARTAAHLPVGGLILESTFTSVPDLGAKLYPWLPVRWLSRLDYDARAFVEATEVPVLVIHSVDDEIVPYEQGRVLYQTAGERGSFLEIRGDHNTGFLRSRERYMEGMERFLESLTAVESGQQPYTEGR